MQSFQKFFVSSFVKFPPHQGSRMQIICGNPGKLASLIIVILEIDECAENPNLCPDQTTCENTYGSYRCNCRERGQNFINQECKGKP